MKPNAARWQAVVFDLDDTLYPERDFALSGFRAVAEWAAPRLGIPSHRGFTELKTLFEQGVRGDTFDRWLAAHGVADPGSVPQLVRIYREHPPQIQPFHGVPSLLKRLRRDYQLGLVSDGHLAVQERKLAVLGLGHHFDAIVFSDAWGHSAWKPNSRPFEAVIKQLGVPSGQAVYVGDNPRKDFIGARRTGMWTIRVRYPDGLHSHLEPASPQYAPDAEIDTLDRLQEILPQIPGSPH